MKELSLFSGAGGGLLASKYFLGWKTLGYVEYEEYCQKVIKQRIKDGLLDEAPIFGDIRTFISEGYAESYKGMVDVITAGFPCQPFSNSGKQKSEKDERNKWPETIQCINIIKPKKIFLENVTGLLSKSYIREIFRCLAKAGYNAKWTCLGGKVLGECVDGERLWIYAFKTNRSMLEGMDIQKFKISYPEESRRRKFTRAVSKMLSQDDYTRIKRNNDVISRGMDRLKAIGNGQVPIVAATVWRILNA